MDYGTLKSAVSDWLARSDIAVETVDLIIDLAEARINRVLRVRAMETVYFRALGTDGSAPVPNGYRKWKTAFLYRGTGTDDTMPSLANEVVMPLTQTSSNGIMDTRQISLSETGVVSRIGPRFYVGGIPSGTYSLGGIVYASFTPLSDSATTNWLTDNAPDLLLSACMMDGAIYIKSQEEIALWSERFTALLAEVQAETDEEDWSGPTIVAQSGIYDA